MTPAETFAHSRLEAENLIRQYVPARLQNAVIERLLPAIALTATRADDAEIPIGASKFGGAPDVPESFEWPMCDAHPIYFAAQINLSEVAPFDLNHLLPTSGLLSFFYDDSDDGDYPSGEVGQEEGWRVFHFENDVARAQVPERAHSEYWFKTATISFRLDCSISSYPFWMTGQSIDDWTEEEFADWEILVDALAPTQRHFLMLGHPNLIQDDPRYEAAQRLQRGDLNDWCLLLQIGGDDTIEWMYGDAGGMFYLMHRDDLAAREWDKCWLIAQCS